MFQDFQSNESTFINSVTKACYRNDQSCVHVLAKQGNGKYYAQIPVIAANKTYRHNDLVICRIDGETIEELHKKAGQEYWSLEWLQYVISQMIKGDAYMSYLKYKRLHSNSQ